MELSNQYYLGNDAVNPFYYFPLPLGEVDDLPIYEGDSCPLPFCELADRQFLDTNHPEYTDIPF